MQNQKRLQFLFDDKIKIKKKERGYHKTYAQAILQINRLD